MDLAAFAVILLVTQGVISLATYRWFPDQLFTVSPVAAVVAIVMMRWGGWAAIHAILGGAAFSIISTVLRGVGTGFFSGEACKPLLIYTVGNVLSLAAVWMLKKPGKQRVRDDMSLSLVFAGAVQVLMLLGRMLVAMAAGEPFGVAWHYVTTDLLSLVFTLVLIWIARRVNGLFEDQVHYLRRIQNEEQTEGGGRT